MSDQPRLIEVLMPMEQASVLSPKEKNVRSGGYISTFHVWPARRPLAACRAALLATLLPDPGDPAKRADLLSLIGGDIAKESKTKKDADGYLVVEEVNAIDGGLLAWNCADNEDIQQLRESIRAEAGGSAPRVFDPFAGGGAIPLEAMWLGCDVSASDLNPVAWLLLKGTLEYPQQYADKKWTLPAFVNDWPDFIESMYGKTKKKAVGKRHFSDERQLHLHETPKKEEEASAFTLDAELPWHIRAWGRWVLERATADLYRYYPVVDGEPTVAYLWARTVRDIQTGGRIPILKTFMLARKRGKRIALLPVPDQTNETVSFKLLTEKQLSNAERRKKVIEENPHLTKWGVSENNLEDFLAKGTKSDAGIWSPFEGGRPDMVALTMDEIRQQGRKGLMGIQMTAVCVQAPVPGKKKTEKKYRLPTAEELEIADVPEKEIEEAISDAPGGIPDEATPKGGGKRASRAFSVQNYGIMRWRDLFTPRQLLAASVFVRHTRAAIAAIRSSDPENAEALAVYLTAISGR